MIARTSLASLALLAFAVLTASASTQGAVVYVEVSNRTHERQVASPHNYDRAPHPQDAQLMTELHSVEADALVLYTDYAARAGNDLQTFLQNMTGLADDAIRRIKGGVINDTSNCWVKFEYHMKKIEHDARRAAIYSGDSHHKFLLGHMIVFRMHINKSEDYLKKSEKMVRGCGLPCESTPRVKRWRRLAMEEIHRVRDDIQHTKKAYRDLVSHARRKLNHLRKQALTRERETIEQYFSCLSSEQ